MPLKLSINYETAEVSVFPVISVVEGLLLSISATSSTITHCHDVPKDADYTSLVVVPMLVRFSRYKGCLVYSATVSAANVLPVLATP